MTRLLSLLLLAPLALAAPLEKRAFTGKATYTEQGLGACGTTEVDSSLVTAVQASYFDSFPGAGSNPNDNPVCGRKITATYQGKSVTVRVTDRSVGGSKYDLNLSPTAFQKLAPLSKGVLTGVSWVLN